MSDACKAQIFGWTLSEWQGAYRSGSVTPICLLDLPLQSQGDPAWIAVADEANLRAQIDRLAERLRRADGDLARLPLYGIPFAVKDNIDVEGWLTTAACPEFAYRAKADASVVRRLREAGAIVVGKTNLDQFATGLVGVRSPFGVVRNSFRREYVSGGSSSGSASVVARGLVPFALGTDTAGSGRVPAGFNNIVGLKPTRGWLSTAGSVPACRTLDCIAILALTVEDAECVAAIAAGPDDADPYSRPAPVTAPLGFPDRPRLGVPRHPEFFGDAEAKAAFARTLENMSALGVEFVPIDFTPFLELAEMLYQGPWIAERYSVVESVLRSNPDALDPSVRSIVESAPRFSAVDYFKEEYRRAELTTVIRHAMDSVDALLAPTAPTIYTIDAVLADPVTLNAHLGIYTNFANLADLCALALPAGMRSDGLPAGVTLLAPAWHDRALASFGRRWQRYLESTSAGYTLGATRRALHSSQSLPDRVPDRCVRLAVVGAHLSGMPLNHQLTARGAAFVEETKTAAEYRLFALAGSNPAKPGLARVSSGDAGGAAIAVELWDIPVGNFGSFVAEIPPPLGIGSLSLEDGRTVKGFICEPFGLVNARDITAFGGWRAYLASL